jgi:hypothetical protein
MGGRAKVHIKPTKYTWNSIGYTVALRRTTFILITFGYGIYIYILIKNKLR